MNLSYLSIMDAREASYPLLKGDCFLRPLQLDYVRPLSITIVSGLSGTSTVFFRRSWHIIHYHT